MDLQQKIQAMLRTADPKNGGSAEERQNALRMAEKAMDKEGLSYGSLGFSIEDAQRIANQFSVSTMKPNNETSVISHQPVRRSSRNHGYSIFSSTPGIQRAPKNAPAQEEIESYSARCERLDYESRTAKYEEWEKVRAAEAVEQDEIEKKSTLVVIIIAFILFVAVIVGLYMAGLNTVGAWLLTIGQVVAVVFLGGVVFFAFRFIAQVANILRGRD